MLGILNLPFCGLPSWNSLGGRFITPSSTLNRTTRVGSLKFGHAPTQELGSWQHNFGHWIGHVHFFLGVELRAQRTVVNIAVGTPPILWAAHCNDRRSWFRAWLSLDHIIWWFIHIYMCVCVCGNYLYINKYKFIYTDLENWRYFGFPMDTGLALSLLACHIQQNIQQAGVPIWSQW